MTPPRRTYSRYKRAKVRKGCQHRTRDQLARERYEIVLKLLAREGYSDLILPHLHEAVVWTGIETLAARAAPESPEGIALTEMLARQPQALLRYIERHRAWVLTVISEPHKSDGPAAN